LAREVDLDVDIFPEPTRSIPLGGDVFGGYPSCSRPREQTMSEPAFFGGREQQGERNAWPWAGTVERAEPASESAPEDAVKQDGEPDEAGGGAAAPDRSGRN
jgi:hypothetical protein